MPAFLTTGLTLAIDGVAYGMMLFLISVGLTITLGVMRIVNLAHSAFAMVGGYFAFWATQQLQLPFVPAVLLAAAATMLVGGLLERTLYRWVYATNGLGQMLTTIGLAFIVTALAKNLAGPDLRSLVLPGWLQGNLELGGLTISTYRAFLVLVSGAIALGLWAGMEWSSFGARLRAAVDNPRMARCVGIDVPMVFSITFAIGSGLAALGGALGSPILPLEPYYGLKYLVLVLIVVALGGLGSIRGSFYAALLIGVVDTLGRYYLPLLGAFLIYLLVLGVLIVRPQGLVARA